MIRSQGAGHHSEETNIYPSVENVDIQHDFESNLNQDAHSTTSFSNQFAPDGIPIRSDFLEAYYASPYSSIAVSPASPNSPCNSAMSSYGCGLAYISQDFLSLLDPFISRSDTPSGEIICWESSQNFPSPQAQEIDEFLDLPETNDVFPSWVSTTGSATGMSRCCVEDASSTLASYVPLQARPLISYTEHQRAIYSEHFQYSHEPTGFDMTETTETTISDTSCDQSDNCVSHEFIDADMSLAAPGDGNFFHF